MTPLPTDITPASMVVLVLATLLLGLSTYRVARLVVLDTFPPVARVRDWWFRVFPVKGVVLSYPRGLPRNLKNKLSDDGTQRAFTHMGRDNYRQERTTTLGYLITCMWCFAFWVGLAHVLAFWAWPEVTLQWSTIWAVAAIGSLLWNHERH